MEYTFSFKDIKLCRECPICVSKYESGQNVYFCKLSGSQVHPGKKDEGCPLFTFGETKMKNISKVLLLLLNMGAWYSLYLLATENELLSLYASRYLHVFEIVVWFSICLSLVLISGVSQTRRQFLRGINKRDNLQLLIKTKELYSQNSRVFYNFTDTVFAIASFVLIENISLCLVLLLEVFVSNVVRSLILKMKL